MKKIFYRLLLVVIIMLSLCACSNDANAKEICGDAYVLLKNSYSIADQISEDLYTVWKLSVWNSNEVIAGGASYLAEDLHLTETEFRLGAGYFWGANKGHSWEELDNGYGQAYAQICDALYTMGGKDLFQRAIYSVVFAYKVNGKFEEARSELDAAKEQIQILNNDYSKYEHIGVISELYTTTNSLLSLLEEPKGSFEQFTTTNNDYRNTARDYISKLDLVFSD